jgi:hypothetical protein
MISCSDVLEYLMKSSSVQDQLMKEPLSVVPVPGEVHEMVAPTELTNEDIDSFDLDGMFKNDNPDFEEVDTDLPSDSDSDGSNKAIEVQKLNGADPSPPTTQKLIAVVPDQTATKRKGCECNHDDYFGESYSDLSSKAYFQPNYMAERENPVHFCTGINDKGKTCGYDFTRSDLVMNTKHPVRACKQALKIDTECVHALCIECFATASRANLIKEGDAPRTTRRRRTNPVDENEAKLSEL